MEGKEHRALGQVSPVANRTKYQNGPNKICGRQPLKNFAWSIEYFVPNEEQKNVIYF